MSADAAGVLRMVAEYAEAMTAHKESLTNTPAGPLYNRAHISAAAARVVAADAALRALSPAYLRALAAQAEAGDGYRIALDDALPVLELCLERGRVLDRMTQPSMGRHPLQDEYERVDYRLRRASKWYKLWPIVQQARAALAAAEEVG